MKIYKIEHQKNNIGAFKISVLDKELNTISSKIDLIGDYLHEGTIRILIEYIKEGKKHSRYIELTETEYILEECKKYILETIKEIANENM